MLSLLHNIYVWISIIREKKEVIGLIMVLISEMKIENISRTFCCLYKGLWLWDFIDQYSIIFSTLGIIKTQSEPITYKAKGPDHLVCLKLIS